MKKEIIFDIDLSPKTRVSNKSPFLTLETLIKIPYTEQSKQLMPKKLILVTYTDVEQPKNLDGKQILKEINRENLSEIDLSESFVLLLSFKIEDGKVDMVVNHGSSKKKKKRKIDRNELDTEDTEDSAMDGDCKFHHYKRPCQFQTWGEMQEKEYYDHIEYQMVQKTFIDIKTHFVKNRNHKIFLEAELLVPARLAEFYGMSRRRVGYKATELINYRFELESEIWCAELLQKQISKINFSMDNSKITSLKFSEEHFLKSFDQKRVVELITSLLKLEEVDLSEISLKQNTNFFNHFFPTLYQKCYKLKKIVLQGPKQQWESTSVYQFLHMIPHRNWGAQIYVTIPGKETQLEKFVDYDDSANNSSNLLNFSPNNNNNIYQFQPNNNNNNFMQFKSESMKDDKNMGNMANMKNDNAFLNLNNDLIQSNMINNKNNFANNNGNNNLNNNLNMIPYNHSPTPNNFINNNSTLLNNDNFNQIISNNNFNPPLNNFNNNNQNNFISPPNTINPNKISIIQRNDPQYHHLSKPYNSSNNFNLQKNISSMDLNGKNIAINPSFAQNSPLLFSKTFNNSIQKYPVPNQNSFNQISNVQKQSNNQNDNKGSDPSILNSNGSLSIELDDKLHSSSIFNENLSAPNSQNFNSIITKQDPFSAHNDILMDPFHAHQDFNFNKPFNDLNDFSFDGNGMRQ